MVDKAREKKQYRNQTLSIRLNSGELAFVRRLARAEEMSLSDFTRLCLILYFYASGKDDLVQLFSRELPQRLMDWFNLHKARVDLTDL